MIFDKKNYFYFSRSISQELIIASLFIINTLFQQPSMYSAQGIFQHHFQCLKVHTIHDKIYKNLLNTLSKRIMLTFYLAQAISMVWIPLTRRAFDRMTFKIMTTSRTAHKLRNGRTLYKTSNLFCLMPLTHYRSFSFGGV